MKKHKSRGHFKSRLFLSAGTLLVCIALIVSLLFSVISVRNSRDTEITSSRIVLERVSSQVDALYEQMNITATSITKNHALKQIVYELNADDSNTSGEYMEHLDKERTIEGILVNMMFSPTISNVMMYNREHHYFYYTGVFLSSNTKIDETLANDRTSDIFTQGLSAIYYGPQEHKWNPSRRTVISVCRNFSDAALTKDTIVEVQIPYSVLHDICTQNTFSDEKQILILDENDKIVYPYQEKDFVLPKDKLHSVLDSVHTGELESYKGDCAYYANKSASTPFTTVLISNNKTIQQQTISYIFTTVITVLLGLAGALLVMALILSVITKPLKQLISHIDSLKLEEDTHLDLPEDTLDEFEIINSSFDHMLLRLKQSIAQNYELKIQESNANLTALQAQINPHFLYNALNAISAASEIYGSEVTTKMCQEFSSMMRYVTSSRQVVALIEEINHTKNYLEFMKISNDGNLDYRLSIDAKLYNLGISKLTIQPFVENCFKHAFGTCPPPWKIVVSGMIEKEYWVITIEDNGQGFSEEVLEKMTVFKETVLKPRTFTYDAVTLDGLGLYNTLARLYAHFDGHFDFTIENRNPGSRITLRGEWTNA